MLFNTITTLGKLSSNKHCQWDQADLSQCLKKLGDYTPRKQELFLQAFTHASFVHEHPELNLSHYQRLEFLGDAVINLYATNRLYALFPYMREGDLSSLRSSMVCRESLCQLGRFLKLDKLILRGKGTECSPSMIGDVFEALVGSIYMDQGFTPSCKVLDHLLEKYRKETDKDLLHPKKGEIFDKKSRLQEITLKLYGETPQYRYQKINENCFQVDLWITNHFLASTCKPSKKEAEKILAEKALNEQLYKNIPTDKI